MTRLPFVRRSVVQTCTVEPHTTDFANILISIGFVVKTDQLQAATTKTTTSTMAEEDTKEEEAEEEVDVAALLDLKQRKKKKKPKKASDAADGTAAAVGEKGAGVTTTTTSTGLSAEAEAAQQQLLMEQDAAQEFDDPNDTRATYTYENLLDRVIELLTVNNPDLVEKKRTRIKPPQLQPVGSRKTLWVNFQEICTMMQRDPQHVYSFLMAELGTQGSIDGNQRLVIRGRYLPKYIESLLRKYVIEYVTCTMCRSPNTELKKDQHTRLYFLSCRDCGSTRSVATVRSGYHATSRADRRAARNAKA
jgi:translation initiation factor 2 subunit 2